MPESTSHGETRWHYIARMFHLWSNKMGRDLACDILGMLPHLALPIGISVQ